MTDNTKRIGELEQAIRGAVFGNRAGLWTALPGTVQSFNAAANTCTVQPGIQAQVTDQFNVAQWVDLPLLLDVPVVWQSGGGATLTFPIKAGDEALVVFASRCIDAWWQHGGSQPQMEFRLHDLSDGFAFIGPRSQPRAITGVSETSVQLRTDSGLGFIDLNVTSGAVSIVAPGGFSVVAPTFTLQQEGGTAAEAQMRGNFAFIGTITSNGHTIDNTHTHVGVESGPDNTGEVA